MSDQGHDILRSLRTLQGVYDKKVLPSTARMYGEAADEIERITLDREQQRYENVKLVDEIKKLQFQLVQAKAYVNRAIASYDGDPAHNNFQRGFLAALEIVRDEAFSVSDETGK